MALTGLLGGFGHYLLIIAHRLAPPAVLAPFMYTQLVWVIALGFLVFADLPNLWTITGASIVVASGLYCCTASVLWASAAAATAGIGGVAGALASGLSCRPFSGFRPFEDHL